MSTRIPRRNTRLLIINPNSSEAMTRSMERSIRSMNLPDSLEITLFTAPPTSPPSINDKRDIELSTGVVVEHFSHPPHPSSSSHTLPTGGTAAGLFCSDYSTEDNKFPYDGILVACYSDHFLVPILAGSLPPQVAVTGIFEASVVATLPLLSPDLGNWGIVTTGPFWEDHLTSAVNRFLGQSNEHSNFRFKGVFSTGLTAGDLHSHDEGGEGGVITPEVVRAKMKEATLALLKTGRIECVVMGCAGMAGLEDVIRSAISEGYGSESVGRVYVIDGVRAGVGLLEQMIKNKRMFLTV